MTPVVLFAGAPSGGHLYPGLAVAQCLRDHGGCEVHFLTSGRALEARILGQNKQLVHEVPAMTPRRPDRWPSAYRRVRSVFEQLKLDAVIGLGGALSLLPGLIAVQRRVPVFLLEQNRVLGRVNRWLARWARRVFLSYPDTRGVRVLRRRGLVVGCPVRAAFRATELPATNASRHQILILGGSQGARAINELAPLALARVSAAVRERFQILHIAGDGKDVELRREYRAIGVEAEVVDYVEDPAPAMAASSLVIGRAGGSTLAEIAAVGRGSLLIPYPHHKDRHQFLNAQWFEAGGAAKTCAEDPILFAAMLEDVLTQPDGILRMANAARHLGRPDAAESIATVVLTHMDALPTDHPVVRGEAA